MIIVEETVRLARLLVATAIVVTVAALGGPITHSTNKCILTICSVHGVMLRSEAPLLKALFCHRPFIFLPTTPISMI